MSPRRSRRGLSPLVSFLLCSGLIVAFVLTVYLLTGPGRSGGSAPTAASPSPPADSPLPSSTPEPTPAQVLLGETADAGQEYIDKLIFLGDSTTYGLYAYDVLPHSQVWTPASGTMNLFNWAVETIDYYSPNGSDPQSLSIADCAAAAQPEYLVITLGINGVAMLEEQPFKDYYQGLIQAIQQASPNTRIICQSIYPVIATRAPEGITNEKIVTANEWVYQVAEATGARYLNTHDALLDSSGGLNASYNNGDNMGIHLNTSGFAVVLESVRTHAWQ